MRDGALLLTAGLDFLSTPILRLREERFLDRWGSKVMLGPSTRELLMAESGALPRSSAQPGEAWSVHLAVNVFFETSITDLRLRRMLYLAVDYHQTGDPELLRAVAEVYAEVFPDDPVPGV